MFAGVNEKLECARYFLDNLKSLAEDARGLHNIKMDKQQEMRANLDGFFFEIISAKDFFLQGMNDRYGVGLPKDEATKIPQLKRGLSDANAPKNASEVIKSIEKLLSDEDSWLWRLNNYRNSATHRELLHMGYVAGTTLSGVEAHLFKDPEDGKKGNMDTEVIPYCEQVLEKMTRFLKEQYSRLGI